MGKLEIMEMIKEIFTDFWKNHNWLDRLIVLTFFLSVTWLKLAPLALVITLVLSLMNRRSLTEIKFRLFRLESVTFWSIAFFLYHIVGMLWSENMAFGWADVGMKASFIIVPLIVSIGNFTIQPRQFAKIVSFLLAFVVCCLLIFASWKSWYYEEDNRWAYYFESEYSYFIHRSYWATYTAMASSWMLYEFFSEANGRKQIYFLCWALLSLSTVLTISKAGIIIWLVLSFSVFIHYVIRRKWFKLLGFGILAFAVLVMFLLFSNSRIASRFQEIPNAISTVQTSNNQSAESNTARMIMWSTSVKVIKDQWLSGTGTGDVKDALLAKNKELNNTGVVEKNLNSHNQFLNTWAQLGIVGFVLLGMIFLMIFRISARQKNIYGVLFGVTLILTMLFESFVETQAGIIPFCILVMLINHRAEPSVIPA
jgi:O-antigen ligase